MTQITENLAEHYAAAVHRILAEEFPHVGGKTLARLIVENVARQAEMPLRSFELIVDEPTLANWRLVPEQTGPDRWRVQVICCKPRPSHANAAREQRINTALRAIELADLAPSFAREA